MDVTEGGTDVALAGTLVGVHVGGTGVDVGGSGVGASVDEATTFFVAVGDDTIFPQELRTALRAPGTKANTRNRTSAATTGSNLSRILPVGGPLLVASCKALMNSAAVW